jgi:catechol 2,3-dioxygenase-like lactoylglutathione lyase family enzyme
MTAEDIAEQAIPILRIADVSTAVAWYGRLGFVEEGVHRFEPGFPAFATVARGSVRLFLSEHEGDAKPGGSVYLRLRDVDAIAARFGAEAEDMEWGTRELELADPDGNRVRIGFPTY